MPRRWVLASHKLRCSDKWQVTRRASFLPCQRILCCSSSNTISRRQRRAGRHRSSCQCHHRLQHRITELLNSLLPNGRVWSMWSHLLAAQRQWTLQQKRPPKLHVGAGCVAFGGVLRSHAENRAVGLQHL